MASKDTCRTFIKIKVMKLIKINTDHYVVVDDSEIKEGDFVINIQRNHIYPTPVQVIDVEYRNRRNDVFKKITHSTQPLEYDEDNTYTYDKVKYIPLSYIKELIGEVDVEKKVSEHFKNYWTKEDGTEMSGDEITADMMTNMLMETSAYKAGYDQALEDNKEKKYTEEDVRRALHTRFSSGICMKEDADKYIESLQPKTEWEVEIVDNKLKLK